MIESQMVSQRLHAITPASPSARKLVALLGKESTRAVSSKPATVTVSEALRLWRTRRKNLEQTRAPIEGLEELLHKLETLAPQRKVDQFGFLGHNTAATVFFTRTGGEYIGSAILEKPSRRKAS